MREIESVRQEGESWRRFVNEIKKERVRKKERRNRECERGRREIGSGRKEGE